MMRKVWWVLMIVIFLVSWLPPGYAASAMSEFLCETGLKFYQQGRYEEALHEFQKALLVEPDYQPALKYIQMLEQGPRPEVAVEEVKLKAAPTGKKEFLPREYKPTSITTGGAIAEMLDLIELQQEMLVEKEMLPRQLIPVVEKPLLKKKEKPTALKALKLDAYLDFIPQPLELEQDKSMLIQGKNIQRFLLTQPEILNVEKKEPDLLLVTGKGIGYTYLHIWDDNGRWTTEWLGVFAKPEGPSLEEVRRKEEEQARNFKLQYSLDWSSVESGRRIKSWRRQSYSWAHGLGLTGETPYGNLDSSASLRTFKTRTDLTYFTLGLSDGKYGPFKDFALRAFDFSPGFANLAFSGASLRGGVLSSPAFRRKLYYQAFWGRESGGRYGNLSPNLTKSRHSFLDGFHLTGLPAEKQNYNFSIVHGWGRDRPSYLNRYGYDLSGNWQLDKWLLGYDLGQDSEHFGHLLRARFSGGKLNFGVSFRDVDRRFLNITGSGFSQGQIGGALNLGYRATEKLSLSQSLDVYRERLYPAPEKRNRLNENFSWRADYSFDPTASLNLSYSLDNHLGATYQYRNQSSGIGLSKRFKFIREIYTYLNLYHQDNESFSSHTSDYLSDRVYSGLRFNLIGRLYYYLNKEWDWVNERYYSSWSSPEALETGIDWSDQLGSGRSPWRGSFRLSYRDEEDTEGRMGFMSGQDYLDGYSEISCRFAENSEVYGSARVRNLWAEKETSTKSIEGSFNAGMRYFWDTGLRWDSVGNIEGYVFKDLNSDGLRQNDEPPIEGVKLWLGKDKSQVSDLFGYYKFKGVRGRKAYVDIDASTIPEGYVLTSPTPQEVPIVHHTDTAAYFGLIAHTQISGIVFEDANADGVYNKGDKAVAGAVLKLDEAKEVVSDGTGSYLLLNVSPGEHTLTLDLDSLPVYYLPKTALTKEIILSEGAIYNYNIPLRKIEE